MIADAFEQQLFVHMFMKLLNAMLKLYENIFITLEEIRFESLNSLDTMAQLMNKLHYEWKRTWVEESVQLEKNQVGLLIFLH